MKITHKRHKVPHEAHTKVKTMLASNRFGRGNSWRRERDSFSARPRRISKLLILQEAHKAQEAFQDQGTHERHTCRPSAGGHEVCPFHGKSVQKLETAGGVR